MPKEQEIFTGQKVWIEKRKHADLPNWMDCYGKITAVIRDDDGEIEELIVSDFDSGPAEFITIDHFHIWDDKSQCWMLYGDVS